MTAHAIVSGRAGRVTPWLPAVMESLGYVFETVTTDAPEHGRYYIPPGVVNDVADRIAEGGVGLVVIDGDPHIGQLLDLADRLPSVSILDRAGAVWSSFAAENPVADARLELREARLERLAAERRLRTESGRSPSGTASRVGDLERRCTDRRERVEDGIRRAEASIEREHRDADAYVVVLNLLGASPSIGRGLFFDDADGDPSPPMRAETTMGTLGPHRLAVTETPALPWEGTLPEPFESVVPETIAALRRADFVVGHESGRAPVVHLVDRFDARLIVVESATPMAVQEAIGAALPVSRLHLTLPHGDPAQATLSWLYEVGVVSDVSYGEAITATVTVSRSRTDAVMRRIREVGGRADSIERTGG